MAFIPHDLKEKPKAVPYFEDSSTEKIAGYSTRKTTEALKSEIADEIYELGGELVRFVPGTFPGTPTRSGFQIHFTFRQVTGRIDVAALPCRTHTEAKQKQALNQALFLVRDWLKAERLAFAYRPGSVPLLPYLIGTDGETVTEVMVKTGIIAALPSGK